MKLEQPVPGQVPTQEKAPQPKVSWLNLVYHRAPWIRVRYGQQVKPHHQQSSNTSLSDEQVMHRREEPVGHSDAFTLNGTGDRGESPARGRRSYDPSV